MPSVRIKGVGEDLTLEQKQEIIRAVTVEVVRVEGEGLRPVRWVTMQSSPPGAWGVGGQPVTDVDLRSMSGRDAASR